MEKPSLSRDRTQSDRKIELLLAAIPLFLACFVWFSALAFVPVPWPDDSAFYFVGKDFFSWPPRWVMIPQAPFEPTYRIFNFNTMPLYPILIGAGRFLGIDGSFGIKFWPLAAWGLSGSLAAVWLYRAGLPSAVALLLALCFGLDPIHRWASVLVRPESLIGLFGIALVLGLIYGFPQRFRERRFWDPVAALLALAAYAHFNAIHLLFPVILAFLRDPRRLWNIGWKTALYLSPWLFLVLTKWNLFIHQMTTQWTRLAIANPWLDSVASAITGLNQNLGSPEGWPSEIYWMGVGLWIWILLAMAVAAAYLISTLAGEVKTSVRDVSDRLRPLGIAAGWVIGSVWLWHTKPEVWFVYYIHLSAWCFAGITLLKLARSSRVVHAHATEPLPADRAARVSHAAFSIAVLLLEGITLLHASVDLRQLRSLASSPSWRWSTYHDYVGCIDERLSAEEKRVDPAARGTPFTVWNPTFPDVTVELSRRHPEWIFTRTNDFHERNHLAIQHGHEVDAVVIAETLSWPERTISAPMATHPEIQSVWMNWQAYFLNELWRTPNWKPNRWLCQRGRWQAFIFMK